MLTSRSAPGLSLALVAILSACHGCGGPAAESSTERITLGPTAGGADLQEGEAPTLAWPIDSLPGTEEPRLQVSIEDGPARGAASPLVTIVEISDFQCPFCARAHPTIERLLEEYPEELRIVFRHNPLPFHDRAAPAARLSVEAYRTRGDEGFWQLAGLLFQNSRDLSEETLLRLADRVGIEASAARAAVRGERHAEIIARDQAEAARLGARGTPSFFLNGRELRGAQPIERFRRVIDEEIALAREAMRRGTPRSALYAAAMQAASRPSVEPPRERAVFGPRAVPDPAAIYHLPLGPDEIGRGGSVPLVTLVLHSDFECPFCGRIEATLDALLGRYGADLRVVWRNNPLLFHQNAMPAAEAALEAYAQGGESMFWAMHALLFANQSALDRAQLETYAQQLRLDLPRFSAALDQHLHRARIEREQAIAQGLGAEGTPTSFINGRQVVGAQPVEVFAGVIDEELARARALIASGTPRAGVYEAAIRDGSRTPQRLAPSAASPGPAPAIERYQLVPPRGAPSRGDANAPLVIQIFSDFQCPFCGRVGPTLEQLLRDYAGRIRLVWRNYPLPFHADAELAAEAALEVFDQLGDAAFWAYHDLLFQNQRALGRAGLEAYAQQLPVRGLDLGRFRAALDQRRHRPAVQADLEQVRGAGMRIGTPAFLIGERLLQGAHPIDVFRAAIDAELAPTP